MPNVEERERIWRVQLHARKTPLADDVDFPALAEAYSRSGGDIKNAVLKAAQIATVEPGPDATKRIHQRHFVQGMQEVIAAEAVMGQSLFDEPGRGAVSLSDAQEELRGELALLAERLDGMDRTLKKVAANEALQRQQGQLLESLTSDQRRRERMMFWLIAGAVLTALGALTASLII
jgi:SpoVK/Ycf46/Vps4 family AAA+-type ATPase